MPRILGFVSFLLLNVQGTGEKFDEKQRNKDEDPSFQNQRLELPLHVLNDELPDHPIPVRLESVKEKQRHEETGWPSQKCHDECGPNSAGKIKMYNIMLILKLKEPEPSGRKQNIWIDLLCLLYEGMKEARKNITKSTSKTRISLIAYLFFFTKVQSINSLQTGMANQAIHFGEDVKLECSFQQKEVDQTQLMQWYKGNHERLTHGITSTNNEKYSIYLNQQGDSFVYILTIKNLSVEDFGTYICQHNFNSKPFALYPDQTPFVHIPSEKEITAFVSNDRGFKEVTFSIGLVYPKPTCSWNYNATMENLQTSEEIKPSTDGHLYRINITRNFMKPAPICAIIDLKCTVSGFPFNKAVRINDTGCQEDIGYADGSSNFEIILGVCLGVGAFMVIGISMCLLSKRKCGKTFNKETSHRTIEENETFLA